MDCAERFRPPPALVPCGPWRCRRHGGLCVVAHRRSRPGYDAARARLESRRERSALDLSDSPEKRLGAVGSRGLDIVVGGLDRSLARCGAWARADQASRRLAWLTLPRVACPASPRRPRGDVFRADLDFQRLALNGSRIAVLAGAIDHGRSWRDERLAGLEGGLIAWSGADAILRARGRMVCLQRQCLSP